MIFEDTLINVVLEITFNHLDYKNDVILIIDLEGSWCWITKIPTNLAGILLIGIWIYIIPGIPPPPIGGIAGGLSSLISEITHSVVSSIPATEAAFSRATLTTLAGSITPDL